MKRSLQSATSPIFRAIWVIKSKSVIKRWCISIDSDAYYHHYPTFSHHINPRLTSLQHMSSPAPVDLACKSWDGDPIYKHPLLCSNFPSLHNYEENGGTKKLNNASICGVPVRVQPKSQPDNTRYVLRLTFCSKTYESGDGDGDDDGNNLPQPVFEASAVGSQVETDGDV